MNNINQNNQILFIDDEVNFLNSLKRSLIDEPYTMYFARSANEALEILKSQEIAVVATDLQMPEITGIDLLKIVKMRYPEIIRVIVTGIADVPSILSAIHTGETHRYLTKPIDVESSLIPTLRQSIDLYHIKKEKKKMVEEIIRINNELRTKNEEIEFFKNLVEKADHKKIQILDKIRKEITPMVGELSFIQERFVESKAHQDISSTVNALKQRKTKLIELLKEIEQFFVHIDVSIYDNEGEI